MYNFKVKTYQSVKNLIMLNSRNLHYFSILGLSI